MINSFFSLIFMILVSCRAASVGPGMQTSMRTGFESAIEGSNTATPTSTSVPQSIITLSLAAREATSYEMSASSVQRARLLSAIFGSVAVFSLLVLLFLLINRDRLRRPPMPVNNDELRVSMERSVSVTRDSMRPQGKPNMFQIPVRIVGSARREMRSEHAQSMILPIHDVPPALLRAHENATSPVVAAPRTPPGIYVPIAPPRTMRSLSTRLVLSADNAVSSGTRGGKTVTGTGVIVIHPPRPPRRQRAPSPPPTYAQSTNPSPTLEMSTVPYDLPRYHY